MDFAKELVCWSTVDKITFASVYFIWFTWATIYAVLFCSIACFFELLCVLLYAFVFPKLPIVKFYRSKAASEGSLTVAADLAAGGIKNSQNPMVSLFFNSQQVLIIAYDLSKLIFSWSFQSEEDPACVERLSTKQLLLQNIDYALDMFLIYILTLSIFPGFLAEDTGSHSLGSWYCTIWTSVVYFSERKDPLTPCHIIMQVCTHLDCKL